MTSRARDLILARRAVLMASALGSISQPALAEPEAFGCPAEDQVAANPTDADMATAKALFIEGSEAFEAGDYEAARDRFQRAYKLSGKPALLLNIAHAQSKLEDPTGVHANLARFRACVANIPEPESERVQSLINELDLYVAQFARFDLEVWYEGYNGEPKLFVDGIEHTELRRTTSQRVLEQTVYLAPGEHTLILRVDHHEGQRTVEAVAGKTSKVRWDLPPTHPPMPCLSPPPPEHPWIDKTGLSFGLSAAPTISASLIDTPFYGGGGIEVLLNFQPNEEWQLRWALNPIVTAGSPAPRGRIGGSFAIRRTFEDVVGVSLTASAGYMVASSPMALADDPDQPVSYRPQSGFYFHPEVGIPIVALDRFEIAPRVGGLFTNQTSSEGDRFSVTAITGSIWFSYIWYDSEGGYDDVAGRTTLR